MPILANSQFMDLDTNKEEGKTLRLGFPRQSRIAAIIAFAQNSFLLT
jgi:hypothetical protein